MLGNTVTLDKNVTPDQIVFTQVSAGEYTTVRKDVSGTYSTIYDTATLKISHSVTNNGLTRSLCRLDCSPVPTEAIPDPADVTAYLVLQYKEEGDISDHLTDFGYLLQDFLNSADYAKFVAGEH